MKHSCHSFGTPLQPAHTSGLLRVYKRRRELRKRENKHSFTRCQVCCEIETSFFLHFYFGKITSTSEDMWDVFLCVMLCVSLVRGNHPCSIICRVIRRPIFVNVSFRNTRFFYDLRCQPRARGTAGVPLTPPGVQQESVSRWTAADAVKRAAGSSLTTAARHGHVITPRDWSATSEGAKALLRASVEVSCCRDGSEP